MTKLISHSARPSRLTKVWHAASPAIPHNLKFHIRQKCQYLHSRHLGQEDCLLLSYPKSGSTWLRSMLFSLLSRPGSSLADLAYWVPPLHLASSKRLTIPRVVRSHDAPETPGFSYAGKMLVLVRDPRALVVSYCLHQNRRDRKMTMEESTELLLTSGFDNIGSWRYHIQQTLKAASRNDVKLIKYEDMESNTVDVLTSISQFFGLTELQLNFEEAVEENSRGNLRSKRLDSGVETSNLSDVRNSTASSWKSECPEHCQEKICSELDDIMSEIGYIS